MNKAHLSGRHFMIGDVACAEGALAAGCRFFAGYPITPASEVMERMSRRLPTLGGHYIQMEDELASMAAILGASWSGAKAMTATSGPGFSLMQENIGLGMITETPCVLLNVQRGGPSTGLPTLNGQGDMMQAQFGSHGDYRSIAYVPSSPQEMFDFTIKAFNTAEKYRLPVFIMADELIGHMNELVNIPEPEDINIIDRERPQEASGVNFNLYQFEGKAAPMPKAGGGYKVHVTGLTHNEKGYPSIDVPTQRRMLGHLISKVESNKEDIVEYDEQMTDDAEVVVIAYGSTVRSARAALSQAREKGIKAGLLRLITVWPFPEEKIKELDKRIKGFVFPEVNYGQLVREAERFVSKPVIKVSHPGGDLIDPEAILEAIEESQK